MPTTSSPWASPSSPAGRRLLQSEPGTADDIPVLDDASLALGAALAAATDARLAAASPAAPAVGASRPRVLPTGARPRATARRALLAAALVGAVLALSTTAGLAGPPAPAASQAAPAMPLALGRAAGAMAADVAPPVAGGAVAVELIEPTETLRATPTTSAPAGRSALGAQLGTLAALRDAEAPAR